MAASKGIRIRVRREELIKAIEAKVAACDKEFEKAMKAYRLLESQWPAKVKASAKEWLAAFEKDPTSGMDKWGDLKWKLPPRPSEPVKPEGGHRLLQMLRMGSDDVVSLTEEQYAEYMTACRR